MFWIALALFILLPSLLCYIAWTFLFARNHRTRFPAISYHHIEPETGFPATKVTLNDFEQQMSWLSKKGYRTLTPDDFLKAETEKDSSQNASIFIGFEDAYASVAEHALPLLKAKEMTATLFVIADHIGKTNTWDVAFGEQTTHMDEHALREALREGFTLGSHTLTHPDLRKLSDAELRRELEGSKKKLEDLFGIAISSLSYPFGRYNSRVRNAAIDAGYSMAFTINRPIRQKSFDPYAIPTTGIYGLDGILPFRSKVQYKGNYWMHAMRDKMINRFACGTILVKSARYKR